MDLGLWTDMLKVMLVPIVIQVLREEYEYKVQII